MRYAIVPVILLVCCAAQGLDFANMKFFPVKHPECKGFVVIAESCLDYRFYYLSPQNTLEVILEHPKELYPNTIEEVIQSPDGEKVLILSTGEGHPGFGVYRITDLVQYAQILQQQADSWTQEDYDKGTLPCLGFIDLWPGSCYDLGWGGDNIIEFRTDGIVDFNVFDPEHRRGMNLDRWDIPPITWRWDHVADTFTAVHPKSTKRVTGRFVRRERSRTGRLVHMTGPGH